MPKFASTGPGCSTVLVKEITLGMTMLATLATAHSFLSPTAMVCLFAIFDALLLFEFLEVWLTNFCLLLVVSDISKQLELGPDMAKVRRALNIPRKFREWHGLLSEYRDEDGGLPPAEDVERWKQNGPDLDDLSAKQDECFAEPPPKRKADVKSSRTPATSLRARNVSPLRKKPRLPSAEKTQVGAIPASSARVKHLVGADSKKIGGMRNIRMFPLSLLLMSLEIVICSVK